MACGTLSRGGAFVVAWLWISAAAAQTEVVQPGPLRSDFGLGFGWAHGAQQYGLGVFNETRWRFTDGLAAGVRLEADILGGAAISTGASTSSLRVAVNFAALGQVEYALGAPGSPLRPFASLGVGLYSLSGQSAGAAVGAAEPPGRFFGVAPQLGADFGGFRVGATYHYVAGADVEVAQSGGYSRNYLLVAFSFVGFRGSPGR